MYNQLNIFKYILKQDSGMTIFELKWQEFKLVCMSTYNNINLDLTDL